MRLGHLAIGQMPSTTAQWLKARDVEGPEAKISAPESASTLTPARSSPQRNRVVAVSDSSRDIKRHEGKANNHMEDEPCSRAPSLSLRLPALHILVQHLRMTIPLLRSQLAAYRGKPAIPERDQQARPNERSGRRSRQPEDEGQMNGGLLLKRGVLL